MSYSLFLNSYTHLSHLDPSACIRLPIAMQKDYIKNCKNREFSTLITLASLSQNTTIKRLLLHKIKKIFKNSFFQYSAFVFTEETIKKYWNSQFKNICFLEKEYKKIETISFKEKIRYEQTILFVIGLLFINLILIPNPFSKKFNNYIAIIPYDESRINPSTTEIILFITLNIFATLSMQSHLQKQILSKIFIKKILHLQARFKKINLKLLKENKELIHLLIQENYLVIPNKIAFFEKQVQ